MKDINEMNEKAMENFIGYCNDMKVNNNEEVALEENVFINRTLASNKELYNQYNASIDKVVDKIRTDKKYIKHALGKHSDYESAKKFIKDSGHNEVITYIKSNADLIEICIKTINNNRNLIMNKLFMGETNFSITDDSHYPIGIAYMNQRRLDKDVTKIRISFIAKGYNKDGNPNLILTSVYPYLEKYKKTSLR